MTATRSTPFVIYYKRWFRVRPANNRIKIKRGGRFARCLYCRQLPTWPGPRNGYERTQGGVEARKALLYLTFLRFRARIALLFDSGELGPVLRTGGLHAGDRGDSGRPDHPWRPVACRGAVHDGGLPVASVARSVGCTVAVASDRGTANHRPNRTANVARAAVASGGVCRMCCGDRCHVHRCCMRILANVSTTIDACSGASAGSSVPGSSVPPSVNTCTGHKVAGVAAVVATAVRRVGSCGCGSTDGEWHSVTDRGRAIHPRGKVGLLR